MKKQTKVRISQETFDECVRENMEEFDMPLEEATLDAIQQFESQKVDLSNIIKHRPLNAGSDNTEQAETVDPLQKLKSILGDLHSSTDSASSNSINQASEQPLVERLTLLQELFDQNPEAKVIAGCNNAIDILMDVLVMASSAGYRESMDRACMLLVLMCSDNTDNQDFLGEGGIARLTSLLSEEQERTSNGDVNVDAHTRLLGLLKAACHKHEANKAHFTAKGQGVEVLSGYFPTAKKNSTLSKQLATVLRMLTINDDPNATFSQAQETIKQLVAKDLIAYVIDVVEEHKEKPDMLSIWLAVLKQLAITEENCKKIYELRGLDLLYQVTVVHEDNLTVMTRCITVFRNVAAADELKEYILKSGGVDRILHGMRLHIADASLQQHACATLAALALRSPENSVRIVELRAPHHIAIAMRTHRNHVGVLRQASLAIRNLVARSAELRPRILEEDVEPLLRDAQQYRGCGDEAYAALRDLGCDIQLAAFGTGATMKAQFNPVHIESNKLLESVEEAAEAPFAR